MVEKIKKISSVKSYAATSRKIKHAGGLYKDLQKIEKVESGNQLKKIVDDGIIEPIEHIDYSAINNENLILPIITNNIDDRYMLPTNLFIQNKTQNEKQFKHTFRNEVGKKFNPKLNINY